MTRHSILGAGKTPEWAGATPPLAAFSRPKTSWGRSSPARRTRDSFAACFAGAIRDSIGSQNRGPIPSGFGSHSRLELLEDASRVLAPREKESANL